MPHFEIKAVSPQVRDWSSQRGDRMKSYRITLTDEKGVVHENVEWARKDGSQAPAQGEKVEGDLDTSGQYGPKFKMTPKGFGGGGGGRGKDPKERAEIRRQHAQTTAIRWAELTHARGLLPEDFKTPDLMRLVEHFFNDSGSAKA